MTLKEYMQLVNHEEKHGATKKSKVAQQSMISELMYKRNMVDLVTMVVEGQLEEEKKENFEDGTQCLKEYSMLKGEGTKESPFEIQTECGVGKFFALKLLFENNTYPEYIKHKFCHHNCYLYALQSEQPCVVITGICHYAFSFLHTVVCVGDMVYDFNYHIAMSKDLYCELFNFEIINEVPSEKIKENHDEINKVMAKGEIPDAALVACYDEVFEMTKIEEVQV